MGEAFRFAFQYCTLEERKPLPWTPCPVLPGIWLSHEIWSRDRNHFLGRGAKTSRNIPGKATSHFRNSGEGFRLNRASFVSQGLFLSTVRARAPSSLGQCTLGEPINVSKPGQVAHTSDAESQETKARGQWVQRQPKLIMRPKVNKQIDFQIVNCNPLVSHEDNLMWVANIILRRVTFLYVAFV